MSHAAVNYIVLAIPVFFLLIGGELLFVRLARRDYYRLNDAVSDLSCGTVQQIVEVFLKTALFSGYLLLFERFRVATLPTDKAWVWVAGFLGVDFFYYWFHRMSHEVNAIWATHVVHHQSEEYNLAVALRQGAFQSAFSSAFYLPLALLGFPPVLFLTLSSLNTLYQFWIHTRAIGKLGPLDRVLNTPSNHRVHHGRNPNYIDRNHGGTLIVWDRLFGTYQPEQEEVVYGITKPLASFNPIWANLHYWIELVDLARRTGRWADRLRVFAKPPGWRPAELGGFEPAPEVDARSYRKWDVEAPAGVTLYVFAQFVVIMLGTGALLNLQDSLSRGPLIAGSLLVVLSLVALGGLLERRVWAPWLEATRLIAIVGFASVHALSWLGLRS
jgi:sterol desaturase/sphingolipid hydroxylase (fatty acid hydroxylase superfamily)